MFDKSHSKTARVGLLAGVAAASALAMLAGCSATGSGGGAAVDGKGKVLNVWYMQAGPWLDTSVPEIDKQFEQRTGATVKVEVQQWDQIVTKLTTALASDNPPDVLEIGNTNVGLFAANGALVDLTSDRKDLEQGESWLPPLTGPATIDGKLYASPLHAGTRAVVYNTEVWAAAGVTQAPKTYDELLGDLDKIRSANPGADFSPLYLAGGNWYVGLQFVFDAGGSLATEGKDGKWVGGIASSESQKGLEAFKRLQNAYSMPGSQTAASTTPDPNTLLETGKASAIVAANPTSIPTIEAAAPQLKGKLASFVLPSIANPGTNMPSWVGGTELAISAKSKNIDLAKQYLKLIASPEVQKKYVVGIDGDLSISKGIIDDVSSTVPEAQRAFYTAATKGLTVPNTPNWTTLESDNSIASLFIQVAAGQKSVRDAAESFNTHLESVLNSGD